MTTPVYNAHSPHLTLYRDCLTRSSNTRAFSLSLRVLFITTIWLHWRWIMMTALLRVIKWCILVCVKYAIWLVLNFFLQ